ncbi:MAG: hypothetical protein APF80_14010 [Alphaproteobacteria bacterium BRH_c36]|nr:MAG: hypothetical protein APF80_14010 [Alphaproteobacteria bacterium BRH_c36]
MSTVSLIDDDNGVLDAVSALLRSFGHTVACHDSAETFLAAPFEPGCIVTDLRMPGLGGMGLLSALRNRNDPRAVILITAHGDVEHAVKALKLGALDFIEKPFEEERLLEAIDSALVESERHIRESNELCDLRARYETLSRRQKEVMWLVADGCANKEIAARLEISIRTVETYRAWVLEKMHARTLADLVRIALMLERSGTDRSAA